jgi:hypothetical protein
LVFLKTNCYQRGTRIDFESQSDGNQNQRTELALVKNNIKESSDGNTQYPSIKSEGFNVKFAMEGLARIHQGSLMERVQHDLTKVTAEALRDYESARSIGSNPKK